MARDRARSARSDVAVMLRRRVPEGSAAQASGKRFAAPGMRRVVSVRDEGLTEDEGGWRHAGVRGAYSE